MEGVRKTSRGKEKGTWSRRRPGVLFPVLLVTALLMGCSGGGSGDGGLSVSYRLDPAPPAVGSAALELRLVDPEGKPVKGATVELEANMNHAGMRPTFATLTETADGRYDGDVEFTMGGDWFLLMKATLADGRTVQRTLDVKGVRSQNP
jgi:hypothetical protein